MIKVRPFDTVKAYEFPDPIGTLEGFCTDGLASLVYTMKGMKTLDEITLRWPGHVDRMKVLMESGYFSREKVDAGGTRVAPLEVSYAVLGRKLSEGDPRDITVMRVMARGKKGSITYDMADRYDEESKVTSMGKTTGYTGSIVTQMLGGGEIRGKGVVPPERAVTGEGVRKLLAELGRRGVRFTKTG